MRTLFPICFAALLLVLATTCEKAHFVHRPDDSVAGGAAGGTGGEGGAAGGNAGTGGALCQLSPQDCSRQPGQVSISPCDPVCQSGTCPCGQKCTYAGTDAKPVCAGQGTQKEFESCTVTNPGLSTQRDDCAPGDICLAPVLRQLSYCFRLCYQDSDCLSYADCSQRSLSSNGGQVSVCSPAHQLCGSDVPCCDPLNANINPCPSANPVCFLVAPDGSTGHSRTVCEYSSGGSGDDTPCTSSRECMESLTCADADRHCHPVCDLAKPACPGSMTCKAWGTEYGYCTAN